MKKINTPLLLAALVLLASCEKETHLTIDQSALSFTNAGGSQNVSLVANKPWTASPDQPWCKVSPSGGEEATIGVLSITCEANPTYDDRTCTVTFTCEELTKTLSISQSANNGLQVSQTSYELNNFDHQLNIQVQANVKFSVEVDNSCKDWIKYVATRGLAPSTVVLDILENTTYDNREGKVTIKQEEGNLSSTITIKQSEAYGILAFTSWYNVGHEATTIDVEVRHNVDLEVVIPDDCKSWIKHVKTKGLPSNTYTFSIAANETYDDRLGNITFKQKKGELSTTVTTHQSQTDYLKAEQTEYQLTLDEQDITVNYRSNVSIEVVIDDASKDWMSSVDTKGLLESVLYFHIKRNEGKPRQGTVVLKGETIQETITIYQGSEDFITFEDPNFKAYCVENFDENKNGEISIGEARSVTGIQCSGKNIRSLSGIEQFVNVNDLDCSSNQLTSLDVSFNPSLNFLVCINNPNLTEIWLRTGQTIETFTYDKDVATVKYKANY